MTHPATGTHEHEGTPLSTLVWELVRHTRLVHQIKQVAFANAQLDAGALGLLWQLTECGAARQGQLADRTRLDPSTVSRHVAQLVKAGLVVRRPDPEDGRAVQLAATDAGRERITDAKRRRVAMVADALKTWNDEDVAQLTELLTRLNDDIETFHQTETS